MDHKSFCQVFLSWFGKNYPGWTALQNNSGYASAEHVHYGIPSTGGGFDFFCFGPGAQAAFFEIKTIGYPRLSTLQQTFAKNMTAFGFECYVFKEQNGQPGFYVVPAENYRPFKAWPY